MRVNDDRRASSFARRRPAYVAFLVHRLSGLALALFLPLHFWALGQALRSEAELEGFLRWTDNPMVKAAEWGLVLLLAAHAGRRAEIARAGISALARLATVVAGGGGGVYDCGGSGVCAGALAH